MITLLVIITYMLLNAFKMPFKCFKMLLKGRSHAVFYFFEQILIVN